jgi:hypothetical protein
MEQYLPVTEGIVIMGQPVLSLSKKELAATVAYLIGEVEEKKKLFNEVSVFQRPKRYGREV